MDSTATTPAVDEILDFGHPDYNRDLAPLVAASHLKRYVMKIDPVDVIVGAALSVPGRIASIMIVLALGIVASMTTAELYYSAVRQSNTFRGFLFSILNPPSSVVTWATLLYTSVIGIAAFLTLYRLFTTGDFLHPQFTLFSITFLYSAALTNGFTIALVIYSLILVGYLRIPFFREIREREMDCT
ncbi:MAG: hypothetical protein KDN20_22575 [Verrucomicrobiae bacterium]|nr:hypothetical protein [Verrucomicrobiae bacterium]